VRLVEDQHVEVVGPCRHELVEVLEHCLDPRVAMAGDLAQRLRK
jgi:hypothetical protein